MEFIDNFFAEFVSIAWGWQTAVLLLGAGVYFSLRTKLKPFRYLGYAFEVLMGKHPSKDEVGEVSHFRALTASLSGTIGLGNIAGVAVAIQLGSWSHFLDVGDCCIWYCYQILYCNFISFI